MVEFDPGPSDKDYEGCVISLEVAINKMGRLEMEELDNIDGVMADLGSQGTGQRVNVESTEIENLANVKYVYQERLSHKDIKWAMDRLEDGTDFDSPAIWIGTDVVVLER